MTAEGVPRVDTPHVLREYALLADGERGALVGPRGDIRVDVLPALGLRRRLLVADRRRLARTPSRPTERSVWGGYYEPGSLIWRSRWVTDDAMIECREALALPADPGRVIVLLPSAAPRGALPADRRAQPSRSSSGRARHARASRRDDGAGSGALAGDEVSLELERGKHARVDQTRRPPRARARPRRSSDGRAPRPRLVSRREASAEPCARTPMRRGTATEAAWRERVADFDHTVAPRDARARLRGPARA